MVRNPAIQMNTVNISHAIAKGWIRPTPPKQVILKPMSRDERRKQFVAQGLTQRGTPRKPTHGIPKQIIAAAKRDGVGVTAIYNRIKRTGRITLRRKEKL